MEQEVHDTWRQHHPTSGLFAMNTSLHQHSVAECSETHGDDPCLDGCKYTTSKIYCETAFCTKTTQFPKYIFEQNKPTGCCSHSLDSAQLRTAAMCVLAGIRYSSPRSATSKSTGCNLRYEFVKSPIPLWSIEVASDTSCKVFCYNFPLPSLCKSNRQLQERQLWVAHC